MKLKWNVNELNMLRGKGLTFDEYVDVSSVKEMNDEIRAVSKARVKGRVDFGANKATFHIEINGSMILPCSRTLVDVNYPFQIESKETFVLTPKEYDDHEEEDLHKPIGEQIDLMPYILENIALEVPMQIFCEDDNVEGKAPQSGEGWEVLSEDDKQKRVDPRLEKLKEFFKEE